MSPNKEKIIKDENCESSALSSRSSSIDSSYNIDHDPQYQDSIQPSLNFSRLAYNLAQFNETYEVTHRKSDAGKRVIKAVKPTCSADNMKRTMKSLFPITNWLWNYNWKNDLMADIVTGITISVFQVPQSMGYSLLAKVSPVYGLYSSFFPALIYSVMGSSRHSAVGTFAIVSLMTGSLISEFKSPEDSGFLNISSNESIREIYGCHHNFNNIEIASVIALLVGVYQLLFGIFRLGFISVYMSEQLISSFITGSSFYVLTSQIGYMAGIHLKYQSGPLSLFYTYIEFFGRLHEVNLISIFLSGGCIALLLFFKLFLNDKIKQWTKINIPFPTELVIVISSTFISHFLELKSKNVDTVGKIPTGLPFPSLPQWCLIKALWLRTIPMAIVAYAITYSTGKTFAAKHNYEIDSNQELLAIGTTNTISSFFSCLPTAASLSRSAVQESVGGKTQMVSLVNCCGLLFVLLYFGAFLEKLPNCVLAAIICVALKTLFAQISDVFRYCRVNKLDGSIWIVTFLAVIILNVDHGLYVGLAYSLITLIYKSQRPKTYLLGSIDKSDVYVPLKKYASAHEVNGIKIYQFCGPLHFANVEYFKKDLINRTKISVIDVIEKRRKLLKFQNRRTDVIESNSKFCGKFQRMRTFSRESPQPSIDIEELPTHIIIDCSMFSYIDTTGVSALKTTVQEYESIGVKTFLASCAAHVVKMLEKDGFYEEVPPHHVYITIHDALHHALEEQKGPFENFITIESEENHNDLKNTENETEVLTID